MKSVRWLTSLVSADGQQIFSFYLGQNTPARKDYLTENPVVPVQK